MGDQRVDGRRRGHHHHRERSRDYEWREDEARGFLEQAAKDARRRYPPRR